MYRSSKKKNYSNRKHKGITYKSLNVFLKAMYIGHWWQECIFFMEDQRKEMRGVVKEREVLRLNGTLHLLWMRIKLLMELVLYIQPTPSFMMSACGNLNKNPQWRMNPFQHTSSALSWHHLWFCHCWFPLWRIISSCFYFHWFIGHIGC